MEASDTEMIEGSPSALSWTVKETLPSLSSAWAAAWQCVGSIEVKLWLPMSVDALYFCGSPHSSRITYSWPRKSLKEMIEFLGLRIRKALAWFPVYSSPSTYDRAVGI